MVTFGWLMAQHLMREELKCVGMMNGVQSVGMDGITKRLKWSADNWDMKHKVG